MAKVYANLIKKGLKTINDVPYSLKKAVEQLLGTEEENNLAEVSGDDS